MLIDWFTVGAQALNFLILVGLMRRFLYRPILAAIDAREKKIAAELADADAKRAEAKTERDAFQRKNADFDHERAALLATATAEAQAERQRLCAEAQAAADEVSAKRQTALRRDAQTLNQALIRRAQAEVFAIARQALTELASTPLETRMSETFLQRVRGLEDPARQALGEALKSATEPAVVRSAFELPAAERAKIQTALNETFSADLRLRFATDPDVVSGVELTANAQRVAWSIGDYLTSLERGVSELLAEQESPPPTPTAQPAPAPESPPLELMAPSPS